MFKNKIFIFDELNYLFLPLAVLQRIIRRKVYFIKLTKTWQNEKSIKFFQKLGLRWLNYQDYQVENIQKVSRDCVLLQKQIGNFWNTLKVTTELNEKLTKMGCGANDLQSFGLTKIANRLREFCEIIAFVDHIKKDSKQDIVIIGIFPDFFTETFRREIKGKASFLNFSFFETALIFIKLIFSNIIYYIKNLLRKNKKNKTFNSQANKIDLKKYRTIFFPHQGIFYGTFYKKDQFYSKKSNSNFYPSNILHLSIGDKNLNGDLTNEYYKKEKIDNVDFASLGNISSKEIIFEAWVFLRKYYFCTKTSLQSLFFFLGLWLLIKRSLIRLNALPNAKVAIFGYDLVSGRDISIACKIKKIKTIASQERFLCAWDENTFFVLDHYLAINKDVEKYMLNERLGSIKKIKSIGPVRSDLIDNLSYEESVKMEKKVMVLDCHSSPDFYKNGRLKTNSWKQNHVFYKAIIKLAKKNKNIKFIIKGKNYNFIDIPYFKDIKNIISQTENIELYSENKNSPYELIKEIVLTIAIHTSLVDELLFKERPVIIYGIGGYPIYYNDNLIVKNSEELEKKFNLWKEDPKKFNETIINEMRKYFPINKPEDRVYDLLHTYLENEIKYYF